MSGRVRRWSAVVLAVGLVSATVGHANGASRQSRPPIVVAVEAPITGPQSSNGVDILRGARLAVRQANAHGGVLGRPVALVPVDDRGERRFAGRGARRAIERNAVAVVGPFNSSVGLVNLPIYLRNRVVPIHLTSTDATKGQGITVQPKNSQIAPIEEAYIRGTRAKKVTMLVDDTANGAFTIGMANRLRRRLAADGVDVARVSVKETKDVVRGYYARKVARALATRPDLLYVSTFYPEGVRIARALRAAASRPGCLMGLANVDPAFVATAGLAASRRCLFSGIPAAGQLPTARRFTRRFRRAFHTKPGVWGVFAYDSAKLLFRAIERTRTTAFRPVLTALERTKRYRGATGTITIDPATGYRRRLPVSILRVNRRRVFVIAR